MMSLLGTSIFQGWLHGTQYGVLMLSLLLLWLNLTDSLDILNPDVRLVGGNDFNEGRVEIFYAGQWGTICDDNWDMADANVVCRSLGFPGATEVKTSAAFGEGSGPIVLDDITCIGTETSLTQCTSGGWLNHNCGHGEDAGVVCTNRSVYNPGTFVFNHFGNFSEDLGKLFDSQQDCDINITIMTAASDLELHGYLCVHSLILCANSEASILLQQSNNNSYRLLVEEECLPSVNSFLRYFYSRQIEITLDSVKCIHKLASAYGVPGLQADCRQIFPYLLPLDPSFHGALELYEHSLSSEDSPLQQLILQYLAWNCEGLFRTKAWLGLKPDKMEVLLSRTDLVVESEWSLLKSLDRWAQANGPGNMSKGLLKKIRFPMLNPEQLFKLRFNLTLYEDHNNVFQEKILEALEFHTVPLEVLRQYKPQELKSDAYVPRYFASAWSMYLKHGFLTKHTGSNASQSFETPKHPSFLFNTENISWSFTYHEIAPGCQNDHFCSSETSPILHLASAGSKEDTIWYENKALVVCQGSYIIDVLDFKNNTAVVPKANLFAFPCPTGYTGIMALVRPGYKLNA
ncbi:galectin-3-binding protein [Paroedura picta]|uniref:galectin-3-binding protein n=1 Tax=Paroedura picta TaxID=143630 RepID=UPI004056494C